MELPDLIAGLSSVNGCLGVETARTASGKEVIFAWFEDKAAVLRWYHSQVHQATMKGAFPGSPLPGGLHFGGRFAPDALRVDGMRDYSREVTAVPPNR